MYLAYQKIKKKDEIRLNYRNIVNKEELTTILQKLAKF